MSFYKAYVHRLLKGNNSIPVDLKAVASSNNIFLREDDSEGYSGMLLVVDDMALISVKSSILESTRKRFTIAHEMGHFTLPDHITKERTSFQCSEGDLNNFRKNKNKESEANQFAAELLMPEDAFQKRVMLSDPSKDLLYSLAQEFDTSLTATCIRLVNFKTDYALVCSENGRVKWFYRGEEFPFYLNTEIGSPLHPSSFASVYFKTGRPAEEFYEVPAESWIDDSRHRNSASLMEMTLGLPGYNQTLSFLYVNGNTEYGNDEDEDDGYGEELTGYPRFK